MDCSRCEKTHEKCEHCGLRNPTCRRYRCGMCWRLLCVYCCDGEDVGGGQRVRYCSSKDEMRKGHPPTSSCTEKGVGFIAALILLGAIPPECSECGNERSLDTVTGSIPCPRCRP